jgi:hypothetical protein
MASEVTICNLALSHIRGGSINALTEASIQAQQCKLLYPILRDMVLESAPWQFATKIESLALLTNTTVFNWMNSYQYPTDCLKIKRLILNWETVNRTDNQFYGTNIPVVNTQAPVPYQIVNVDGNRVIASNYSDLRIEYTTRVIDPNLFSNQYMLALSHLLASELAVPIAGSAEGRKYKSDSLHQYNSYIRSAMMNNMNEQFMTIPDSQFVTVRN